MAATSLISGNFGGGNEGSYSVTIEKGVFVVTAAYSIDGISASFSVSANSITELKVLATKLNISWLTSLASALEALLGSSTSST